MRIYSKNHLLKNILIRHEHNIIYFVACQDIFEKNL
nr:MAG TPA: hypothetical protein [Caudoviricetes sp.]